MLRGGMEYAAMKRRDLRELCRQHGLATRGLKADLAARIAGALSGAPSAGAESVVEVVVGRGCLKRLGGSGGTSGASKKVRFALDETSEVRRRGRRSQSQVILPLVAAKTRGRRKARKAPAPAAVSGRGRRRKHNDADDSAGESVIRHVGADAPLTRSRMKAMCLHAHRVVESWNNLAEAEEGEEVVAVVTCRKQKRRRQDNDEVITANAHPGISRRITRSSGLPETAVLLSPDVEKMRGGMKARKAKDEHGGEKQAVDVQDLTTAASPLESRRSSRKREDCVPSARKPSKVVVSCRTTRSGSVAPTMMLSAVAGKKRRETRGRSKASEALSSLALRRRASKRKCDVGDESEDSVGHGTFGEVGADASVMQSGRQAVNFHVPNNPAKTEEEGELIGTPTYRKRKQKIQKNAEEIAASADAGFSHRRTRKSSSSTASVLLAAVVEKKIEVGDDKDDCDVKELAEVKILAVAASPIIAESRSYIPTVLKPAKVEGYGRTTRSRSIAAAVLLPNVHRNKVRKVKDAHPNKELPTNLEVTPNDVPATRTLRNGIVQVSNSIVEETHVVGKKTEIKRKAKDSKVAHRLTRNTAKVSMEDALSQTEKEPISTDRITRSNKDNIARNGGVFLLFDDSSKNVSAAKTELGVLDERTTAMNENFSGEEFQNAKGGDVDKQPAVREPVTVRRSARKRVLLGRI